jgi:Protein of unknown function (DUF1552)
MFISKLSLPRRTFLRGLGVTLALPFLDAMVPALTALEKTPARPPLRFGACYVPNGIAPQPWVPTTVGSGFEFTPTLKSMESCRDHVVVVSDLERVGGGFTANHAPSIAAWLSGTVAKRTEGEDVRGGTTIDQIIAKQIGRDTRFPSLEVAIENFAGYVGACTSGYSCAYEGTLAWATPTTPLPTEIDPRVVFERLFGRAGTQAQRLARQQEDRSILDSIAEDANEMNRKLGDRDRVRLGEYLDRVREIERRIQQAESQSSVDVSVDAPTGMPDSYAEHAALMFDLMTVAYQTDLTRVFTFMMGRETSSRTYPEIGITTGHHEVSHHGNKPEVLAAYAKLNAFHVQQFAKFVEKLKATPDGDGSLLDHVLIIYGSGMADGNGHTGVPLPVMAVGGGAGKGHRHVKAAKGTLLPNLWVDVAEKFGCPSESIGLSTGRLDVF